MLPEVRRFDTALWGDDMLSCLHQDAHDHVVLGYLALGLGGARLLDPNMPRAALHDEVIATLERRLARRQSPELLPGLPQVPVGVFLVSQKNPELLFQTGHKSIGHLRWCVYLPVLCKPYPIQDPANQRDGSL